MWKWQKESKIPNIISPSSRNISKFAPPRLIVGMSEPKGGATRLFTLLFTVTESTARNTVWVGTLTVQLTVCHIAKFTNMPG